VVEGGKTHPFQEGKAQRGAKQARVRQISTNQRSDSQVTPPFWTTTPSWLELLCPLMPQSGTSEEGRPAM